MVFLAGGAFFVLKFLDADILSLALSAKILIKRSRIKLSISTAKYHVNNVIVFALTSCQCFLSTTSRYRYWKYCYHSAYLIKWFTALLNTAHNHIRFCNFILSLWSTVAGHSWRPQTRSLVITCIPFCYKKQ